MIDTEFYDRGRNHPVELISLGIASADGRTYYAVNKAFKWHEADPWLRENVLPVLHDPRQKGKVTPLKSIDTIREDVVKYIGQGTSPQFWGYFADWDWLLFCGLFGGMLKVPANFPQLCLDLKQEIMRLRIPRMALQPQVTPEHNALNDAEWQLKVLEEVALREERMTGMPSWFTRK